MTRGALWATVLCTLASCGGGTTTDDGGAPDAGVDAAPRADAGSDAGADAGAADLGGDAPCPDADGDGHRAMSCGGDDCDDADPTAYPGATETCDAVGHDEDCNPATFGSLDSDHDGAVSNACCNGPAGGTRTCGTDCNDTDPTTHPTAPEVCDGLDNDCNGSVDDGLPPYSFYPDCDGDAHGAATASPTTACGPPAAAPSCPGAGGGWTMTHDDCDDAHADTYPGATEHCDGRDDDCNASIEADADADGHFASGSCTRIGAEPPSDDCDDGDALVHPGAGYQPTGICPTGTRYCPSVFIAGMGYVPRCTDATMPCPAGTCTTCAAPTWDYDCNGATDRQPAAGATAPLVCPGAASCGSADGVYYGGTPTCGTTVSTFRCRLTGPPPACTGGASSAPLACR